MDNTKKQQQSFSRSLNVKPSLPAESNRKSSDLQVNKQRNSRRRGNKQLPAPRNDQQQQQRNSKQQQPAKLRSNVDKRPKPRVSDNDNSASGWSNSSAFDRTSCSSNGYTSGSPGLAGQSASYRRRETNTDYELNSVYAHGSKKQNLNHLLNFHYTPRESEFSVFGRGNHHHQTHHIAGHSGGGGVRYHRYNKEQFLQANFQFVIRASAKPQITGSPDTLIDWSLIEQINIQTTEEPQCPICLYPPVAAKLTRCGHAYCWPCLLHYLSLTEKSWGKCPICHEAIHASDLKSCTILQQHALNLNDEITFQLMRRRKGSMYIEQFNALSPVGGVSSPERFPLFCKDDTAKRYSKFLIARRADIAKIIERERLELLADDDTSCPEYKFIQQALIILMERREKLGLFDERDEEEEEALIKQNKREEISNESPEVTLNVEDDMGAQSIEETTIDEVPDNNLDENYSSVEEVGEIGIAAAINTSAGDEVTSSPCTSKYYYFYQSNDGQNIYLHPINVKMLQACYGTLDRAPLVIPARILQIEEHSMDEEHRRKFTCLGHLPLTCQFAVVEVVLQPPIVTDTILKMFKEDLQRRKQERQRRDREERKHEKKINEINDRQMGKLIASTATINLSSAMEFPKCGFEEALPSLSAEEERPSSSSARSKKKSSSYSAVTGAGGVGTASSSGAWGRSAPPPASTARPVAVATVDNNGDLVLPTMLLGDVIAKAMSQRNQQQPSNASNSSNAKGKKQKKSKKMMPIFATGMNYNGN